MFLTMMQISICNDFVGDGSNKSFGRLKALFFNGFLPYTSEQINASLLHWGLFLKGIRHIYL